MVKVSFRLQEIIPNTVILVFTCLSHVHISCAYKHVVFTSVSFCCLSMCHVLLFSPNFLTSLVVFSGLTKKYDVTIPLWEMCSNKDRGPL